MEHVIVRTAENGEFAAIGELRVAAYTAQGLPSASPYADVLRDLGVSTPGDVLVAQDNGRIVGTVMLEPFHPGSEIAKVPDEAEVRALAVAPGAQGRGAGKALVSAVIERAAASGIRHLLLSTRPTMEAAQHLYRAAGFTRLPERDWSPAPGIPLLAYGLRLPAHRIVAE
jgi:ribosomal protein S18 acetylase RimI-like enzyme